MFRDRAVNARSSMSLRVRLPCDGGHRIQELKMAGVTSEPANLVGAVDDESTECGVWQQIIDPVLSTNGIWRAVTQNGRAYNISRW